MKPAPDTSAPNEIKRFEAGSPDTIIGIDRANEIITAANLILTFKDGGAIRLLHAKAGIRVSVNTLK